MRRQSEDYPKHHACSWLYGFVVLIVSDEVHIILVLVFLAVFYNVLVGLSRRWNTGGGQTIDLDWG